MTDRSDLSPLAADDLRLRLFDGPLAEADASPDVQADGVGQETDLLEGEESFEGELPDDLLALAERLTSESHALARTYPAGSPDRLPIGENEPIPAMPEAALVSEAATAEEPRPVARPARRAFGVGTAAAIAFAAIVGAAFYSAATDGTREAVAEIELRSELPGADASASAEGTAERESLESVAGVPVRTVSLSLANERDYRRLESLLRDRSEPEQEAMFDLLGERDRGEATAVRIAF